MSATRGLTTIEAVALNYAMGAGRTDAGELARYILLAKNGFRELNIHVSANIKSVALDINKENYSVVLPDDFQQFLKVGLNVNGHVVLLNYDPTICIAQPEDSFCDDNGNEIEDHERFVNDCLCLSNNVLPPYYDYNSYYGRSFDNNQFVGKTFWLPAGYKNLGLFRIDPSSNIMYLDSMCSSGSQIILDYISNGLTDEKTYITEDLINPLVAYIRYQLALNGANVSLPAAMSEWKEQFNLYRRAKKSIPLSAVMQSIRKEIFMANLKR